MHGEKQVLIRSRQAYGEVDIILDKREAEDYGQPAFEFLVKWKNKSHLNNTWMKERRLRKLSPLKLKNFIKLLETK